jgi:hypothetical protein
MAEVTSTPEGTTVIVLNDMEATQLQALLSNHPTLMEDYPYLVFPGGLAEAMGV